MSETRVVEAALSELHPTQLTAGMIEVHDKRHELKKLSSQEQRAFMKSNPIPAVVGPGGKHYVTDHHHLSLAALGAGVDSGFLSIEADLSSRGEGFWEEMDRRAWVHPLDENGVRHRYDAIPRHLTDLVDDVYRSLARYVRAGGGYQKTTQAFAEFVWADFFRRLIPIEDVREDFSAAVKLGARYAHGADAARMPGFTAAPAALP
jgi:hypothetical protein